MKKKIVRSELKPPTPKAESFLTRGPVAYLAASILLVIPCSWQSRLQAGDLSSHIYNSWLAQLIERGEAPGLSIVQQTTNVLFDWLLSALFRAFGAGMAQRISVSLTVLVFAWGAFAFISVVSQHRAWRFLPWIAMLAYGWVFHMGFFNFYLGLGLCFWALALAWDFEPRRLSMAAPLLAVAYLAHGLPVMWTVSVLAYLWLARRTAPQKQTTLLGAFLCGIVVLKLALSATLGTLWSLQQLILFTGTDQLWVFDNKYLLVSAGAVVLWVLWRRRVGGFGRGPLVQICAITAAGIVLLPSAVMIPGYKHMLVYIAERMSLALAVCICAALSKAPVRSYDRYITGAAAVLFFSMLFRDELLLNRFEDQMEAAVAQLPLRQRVIAGIEQAGLRVNALTHMIDRVCVERCYSYANYEPSTAQFRVRVNRENQIVIENYADSFGMQSGKYVVKERDLPLYQLLADDRSQIQVRIPPAGLACGVTALNLL